MIQLDNNTSVDYTNITTPGYDDYMTTTTTYPTELYPINFHSTDHYTPQKRRVKLIRATDLRNIPGQFWAELFKDEPHRCPMEKVIPPVEKVIPSKKYKYNLINKNLIKICSKFRVNNDSRSGMKGRVIKKRMGRKI